MQLFKDFSRVFGAPAFIEPYLHFFATEEEMRLVVALGDRSLTAEEIASLLKKPQGDAKGLLEMAYQRQVLDRGEKDGAVRYRVGSFYDRLDNFCKFGNYYVLPKKTRDRLDQWCFEEYLKRNHYFEKVLQGEPDYRDCHNEYVLLLDEVEDMIDAAPVVRLLPCNCKMLADRCDHSREVCLILDPKRISDRTGGRDLSREEAKELVRKLDREGLMHTGGPPDWRDQGPGVICNCCACCCYPFRAARQLGTHGKWPRSRYLADYDRTKCLFCGLCARRCHFGAFYFDGTKIEKDGKQKASVSFNPELCWGCGICANACSSGAISMKKR